MDKARTLRWMSLILVGTQIMDSGSLYVSAKELEFEGTTQVSEDEYYPEINEALVTLTVEEIAVASGSQVAEGDEILKVTKDSYQGALDYYEAAIIRARNTLTDTQMDYDIGILEAAHTLELAQANAKQADFYRSRSEKELTDAIEEHEEILEEIAERMEELNEGIDDGSYETGDSTGSGSSSGGASSSGSSSSGSSSGQSGKSQSENESETETDGEAQSSEQETEETSAEKTEAAHESDISSLEKRIAELKEQITALSGAQSTIVEEIEGKNEEYNEAICAIYDKTGLDSKSEDFCGVGTLAIGRTDTTVILSGQSILLSETEISAQGTASGEETQTTEAGTQTTEAGTQATEEETQATEEETQETEAETPETEAETPETEAETQETEAETTTESADGDGASSGTEDSGEETGGADSGDDTEDGADTADTSDLEQKVADLESANEELESEKSDLETQLSEASADIDGYKDRIQALYDLEAERKQLYVELGDNVTSILELETELEKLEAELESGASSDSSASGKDGASGSGSQSGSATGAAGQSGDGSGDQSQMQEQMQGSDSSGDGEIQESSRSDAASSMGGSAGASSGISGSGGSADTQNGTDSASSGTGGSGDMGSGGISGSSQEDSLFGDTYDLTEAWALVEKEPSDADDAEELVEELGDTLEEARLQYEELLRIKEATELEIRYTYDTTILEGKLAEITYQQEVAKLEETLQAAKDALQELQDEKALLEEMTDGVLTAATGGTVATVGYEEGDTLMSSLAAYSLYETDTVTIPIEVSQYDIADLCVGDTVSVEISGYGRWEGVVSEKSQEADTSQSRTSVNYEAEISVDNSSGRLSPSLAATVTITTAQEEDSDE